MILPHFPLSMTPSLYRPYFTAAERELLDASSPDELLSEINLLRVLLSRVLAASRRARELTVKQHAAILSAFGNAGVVIARLVTLQYKLHDEWSGIWEAIQRGKEDARRRMGVYDYFSPPAPA